MVDFLSISQNIVEKKALKQYNVLCIKTYPEGNIMIFKKKKDKKLIIGIIAGVLLTIGLIAAILVARFKNEENLKKEKPVDYGESYERFNEEEALKIIGLYFDNINEKNIDALKDICYSPAMLKTIAVQNEVEENKVLESLKESLEGTSLVYKELKISSHKAYLDVYVESMNKDIEAASGVSNSISDMYEVRVNYFRSAEIGWEEKSDTLIMYVTDGKYHILVGAEG